MKEGEYQNSDKLYNALETFMNNIAEYFKNKNVEDSKEDDTSSDLSYSTITEDDNKQQKILYEAYNNMVNAYNGEWTRSLSFDDESIKDQSLKRELNDLLKLVTQPYPNVYSETEFKKYADGLRKLKKFARKGNNKNIIARLYIKKIGELMNNRSINETNGQDFDNKLLRLKCIYTLLYGKYNEDSVIDALLSDNVFKLNKSVESKGNNKYTIDCNCFDVYRIKKMADMIKKDDKFRESFFTYLRKVGIKKDVFLYLMHDSVARDMMEDYILKNNIGIFMSNSNENVYALDEKNQERLDDVVNILVKYSNDCLNIHVNGLDGYKEYVSNLVNSNNVLLLPYKAKDLTTGRVKEDVIDKYSNIVKTILEKTYVNVKLHGVSNGCFIVSGLAKRIANVGYNIDEVEFESVPIHIPVLNDSIEDIVGDMKNIQNKDKVENITIVNTVGDSLRHPQRRGTKLAKKLSHCGYDNVILKKNIDKKDYILYHMTNDDNEKKKVIQNELQKWCKGAEKDDYFYIRNNDNVIVCQLKKKGNDTSKPVISVFLCTSKEAKKIRKDQSNDKLRKKCEKQAKEAFNKDPKKYARFFRGFTVLLGEDKFVANKVGGHSYSFKIVPANPALIKEEEEKKSESNIEDSIVEKKSEEKKDEMSENNIENNIAKKKTIISDINSENSDFLSKANNYTNNKTIHIKNNNTMISDNFKNKEISKSIISKKSNIFEKKSENNIEEEKKSENNIENNISLSGVNTTINIKSPNNKMISNNNINDKGNILSKKKDYINLTNKISLNYKNNSEKNKTNMESIISKKNENNDVNITDNSFDD